MENTEIKTVAIDENHIHFNDYDNRAEFIEAMENWYSENGFTLPSYEDFGDYWDQNNPIRDWTEDELAELRKKYNECVSERTTRQVASWRLVDYIPDDIYSHPSFNGSHEELCGLLDMNIFEEEN